MTYYVHWLDGSYVVDELTPTADDEIRGEIRDIVLSNYTPEEPKTFWEDLAISESDSDHDGGEYLAIHPREPECDCDDGHHWDSPYCVFGGLRDNPGVFGHGGGVFIQELCLRCRITKLTDTWATIPQCGKQGETSIEYRDPPNDIDETKLGRHIARLGNTTTILHYCRQSDG